MGLIQCQICRKYVKHYTIRFQADGSRSYFCPACLNHKTHQFTPQPPVPTTAPLNTNCVQCGDPLTLEVSPNFYLCAFHEDLIKYHLVQPRDQRFPCIICNKWYARRYYQLSNTECNTCYIISQKINPQFQHYWSQPMSKKIEILNGDTPDWIRLGIGFAPDKSHEQIKALIKFAIAGDASIFDFKRKCWFIRAELLEPLLKGINTLIKQGSLSGWVIEDKRVIIETFENFFENAEAVASPKPESKASLIKKLEYILKTNSIFMTLREDVEISELKPLYRKAALLLHPDRNNGNSDKMAELNVIWSQLQHLI